MRDILIATHIADAWGTADMIPSGEGQRQWANWVTDDLAYLYWQMLQDKWVIEPGGYQYTIPDSWGIVAAWYVYYNGVSPALFSYVRITTGAEGAFALSLGDVTLGTVSVAGGGSAMWPEAYMKIPSDTPAGEYRLKLYAKADNSGDYKIYRIHLSTLPTEV